MSLSTRLRLARTLAWVGLQNSPDELTELVRQLVGKRADLVVIVQPDARDDDLAEGFQAAAGARDSNVILGLAHDMATASAVRADLIAVSAAVEPGRGHQWGLCVAVAGNPASARRALADDRVDALVITPELVDLLLAQAPPAQTASKPWFCQVADLAQAQQLVTRGVRRFAFEAPPAELVGQLRDLLLEPWRTELEQVTFAAMQGDQGVTQPRSFLGALPDQPRQAAAAPAAPPTPKRDALDEGERWVVPTDD